MTPPSAEATRVAQDVVEWLNAHYPEGFRAAYRDGDVDLFDPDGFAGATGWWAVAGPGGGGIESAIYAVLQHAQDLVIEWTTDPWPAVADEPTAVPVEFARIHDGEVEFGFEHGGLPVLSGRTHLG